jgi:hypothetical protein
MEIKNFIADKIFDFIQHNLVEVRYFYLSKHEIITWEYVLSHPNVPWDWRGVTQNPSVTWEIIQKYPKCPWDFDCISENPNITWEIVQNNPDYNWDFRVLTSNHNFSLKFILEHPDIPWNYSEVSKKPGVNQELLLEYIDLDWNWYYILNNITITWDYYQLFRKHGVIKECNLVNVHWLISKNPGITWEDINNNPDYPWNTYFVLRNPNINQEHIDMLLKNRKLAAPRFQAFNPDTSPYWTHNRYMLNTDKISWEVVKKNPKIVSPRFYISRCPNLVWDMLEDPEYHIFRKRYFIKIPHVETLLDSWQNCSVVKRYRAASKIQRFYLKSRHDPKYKLCRYILSRDYEIVKRGIK